MGDELVSPLVFGALLDSLPFPPGLGVDPLQLSHFQGLPISWILVK